MKALTLSKILLSTTLLAIMGSGVKNSMEMNSRSFLEEKSVSAKRIDELTDEMDIATSKKSFHFAKAEKPVVKKEKTHKKISFAVNSEIKANDLLAQEEVAYIQESLSLELVEYYNPKKYASLMKSGDHDLSVSGSLEAANGVVEKIDVTLPSGESLFVEYGAMKRNRFSYDVEVEGESQKARGVIYQLDSDHYMVSLEDGPYAGTRMKFKNLEQRDADYDSADQEVLAASLAATTEGFTF